MARHLILLLLLLLVLLDICFTSVLSWVDLSINCGSDSTYNDNITNITWWADTNYTSNGVGEKVQINTTLSPTPLWNTLRVFTRRKNNCYTIRVDEGGKVLVRASFYYGNYDNKSSPPSFDLQFDGNHWATVVTTNDPGSEEVIYVTKGNTTSICVALINPGQFPFMNFLEIHSLYSTMYSQVDADRALFYSQRFAYGTNQTIRDNYHRVWNSNKDMNGIAIPVAYNGSTINTNAIDNPPEEVLQNAVILNISLPLFNSQNQGQIYMNLYFSEVNSSLDRSFGLYFESSSEREMVVYDIHPVFGNCTETTVHNVSIDSTTQLCVLLNSDSPFPPLINAMEVFFISDPLTIGTNTQDVAALALLQNTFPALQNWSSDPCLPAPYSWDWVSCNSDTPPRITALYLNSSGLSGSLPDISSMTSLVTIDLHDNSFNGSIPGFLGSLPNLQRLNLADNNFSGTIPTSLLELGKFLGWEGNRFLCYSNTSCQNPNNSGHKMAVILGTTLPIALIISVAIAAFAASRFKRNNSRDLRGLDLNIGSFTLRQIKAATNNFDPACKIGEGGFGSVYKGYLADGTIVAVKQLSPKSNQGKREFLNEIGVISTIHHPNLVKLYGCCTEDNQLLVIYEYMENNSLARALFGPKEHQLHLDWLTRHKISVGIARGLAYLHEESTLKIVHRDIKSTNVLLDNDLNAKISDFGMAKLDEQENTHISTRVAGTFGYMAPEYATRGYLTDKADVYSFGVVLLEIVSGRPNINIKPKEGCFYLLDWAHQLKKEGKLTDIIDPRLSSDDYNKEEIMLALDICLFCTNVAPSDRPTMSSVLTMLEGRGANESLASEQNSSSENKMFEAWESTNNQLVADSNESESDIIPFTTSAKDLYPNNWDSAYLLDRP